MKNHPFATRSALRFPRPGLFAATAFACTGLLALGTPTRALADGGDTRTSSKDKNPVIEKKDESRIKYSAFVQAGITGNFQDPDDHQNFGRIVDDRANEPLLNQATFTIERPLAPEPGRFDFGFKAQAGYGSDGRFYNTTGTLENVQHDIVQPYVVEAYGNVHAPLGFLGKDAGLDFRFGQFATLLGAETIDPRTNTFYSHNYIYNFGVPYQHLGALFTLHANPTFDVYAGVTRGVNTSIYDNNGRAAFLGGFGVNGLLGGKLSLLLTTSSGPENPRETIGFPAYNGSGFARRNDFRFYNTAVITYKPTDKLTSITELCYTYDDGFDASFFGGAETLAYAINDKVSAAIRLEAVRDSEGFFVAQFAANDDFTNLERGGIQLDRRTVGGGENTYLEATLGVQIKPLKYLTIRPEVRGDYATNNDFGGPFDDSSKQWSFTVGTDVIIAF